MKAFVTPQSPLFIFIYVWIRRITTSELILNERSRKRDSCLSPTRLFMCMLNRRHVTALIESTITTLQTVTCVCKWCMYTNNVASRSRATVAHLHLKNVYCSYCVWSWLKYASSLVTSVTRLTNYQVHLRDLQSSTIKQLVHWSN